MDSYNFFYKTFFSILERIDSSPMSAIPRLFSSLCEEAHKSDSIKAAEFFFIGDFFIENYQFNQTLYFAKLDIIEVDKAAFFEKEIKVELAKKNFILFETKNLLDSYISHFFDIRQNAAKIILTAIKINNLIEGFFCFQINFEDSAEELFFINLVTNSSNLISSLLASKIESETKKEIESKLKYIFENVENGIVLLNEEKIILDSNSSFDKNFLRLPFPSINKKILDFIDKKETDRFNKAFSYCLEFGKNASYQTNILNSKGELIKVQVEMYYLLNSKKKKNILAIFKDLSENQEYENRLIAERNRAEASERIKANFLTLLSHEIRTPLSNILNYLNLIRSELKEKNYDNVELLDYFNSVENNSHRIIRTIELIVNMANIIAGAYKADIKRFNLIKNVVQPLCKKYEEFASKLNLKFIVEYRLENPRVKADESSVKYILDQILDNAIKFTKEGYVKLSVFENQNEIIAQVEDSGIGISSDYLKRIYEPFSQETEGYTRKYDGCGISLCASKKLAEINNLDLKIESEKGRGTKVSLIFPKLSDEFAFLADIKI